MSTKKLNDRMRSAWSADMTDVLGTAEQQNRQTENFSKAHRHEWPTLEHARIMPDPDQPRKHFDEEALEELAQSILHLGLEEPLKVRQGASAAEWIIKDGERRWRALSMLIERGETKYKQVPVLVDEVSDTPEGLIQLRLQQLTTSLQKKKFTTLEIVASLLEVAEMLKGLGKTTGESEVTATQVAAASGFSPKMVERNLKIGRGLSLEEREKLQKLYPEVGVDPLEGLISWFNSPAGQALDDELRMEVVEFFAKERPGRKSLPLALRPFAAKKRAGRLPAARFKADCTRAAGIEVSIRVPPTRLDYGQLERTERKLEEALGKVRNLKHDIMRRG